MRLPSHAHTVPPERLAAPRAQQEGPAHEGVEPRHAGTPTHTCVWCLGELRKFLFPSPLTTPFFLLRSPTLPLAASSSLSLSLSGPLGDMSLAQEMLYGEGAKVLTRANTRTLAWLTGARATCVGRKASTDIKLKIRILSQ
jgi:hypothetical protein